MNLTPGTENRFGQDGLQEIRSWASRSPEAARPGFRTTGGPRSLRRSSRLTASLLVVLLLLVAVLAAYAGYRFLQTSQSEPEIAAVPEPIEPPAPAAAPAAEQAPAAPEAAEVLPDSPEMRREPLRAEAAIRRARSTPEEHKPQQAALRPTPFPREPQRTSKGSQVVVDEDAFESESAVLLSSPSARYPAAARETGTWAKVTVGFTIDETGAVRDPRIESSWVKGDAPESAFAEEALAAARHARFEPARERGVPTSSWSTLTFTFEAGPL